MRHLSSLPRRGGALLAAHCVLALVLLPAIGCTDRGEPTDSDSTPPEEATPAAPTRPEVADPADWCGGHALPESMCTRCNPELTEVFQAAGDWCAEHSLPESVCPQCNPLPPPGAASADPHAGHDHDDGHRVGDPSDWCRGHGLPESMCTLCNPELEAGFRESGDWCGPHRLPESACPRCNPMISPFSEEGRRILEQRAAAAAELPRDVVVDAAAADSAAVPLDWCGGHGLPESMCTVCNPELEAGFREAGDWCEAHGYPESACPQCNPMEPPTEAAAPFAPGTVIRFAEEDIEAAVGIETVAARATTLGEGVESTGRVAFDGNATAEVRSAVSGIVRAVHVDLGDVVAAGQPLFDVESADLAQMQARRRGARQRVTTAESHLDRQERLRAASINAERDVELARQDLAAARAELRAIDDALSVAGSTGGVGVFAVTSPIAGRVIRREAVLGSAAGDAPLAVVSNTQRMWVLAELPEWQAGAVGVGRRAEIRVDGGPAEPVEGEVTWIASEVDPHTRAVSARIAVANPEGRLRAGQFAQIHVQTSNAADGVAVPRDAVQRVDESAVLFVRSAVGVYEPREVTTGRSDGRWVHVQGVSVGEPVVTTGAYLLRTELTRDAIGAGCCEVELPSGAGGD